MTDQPSRDNTLRNLILGIIIAPSLAYAGWVGMQVSDSNQRLTRIEATMDANKEERLRQVTDLDRRVTSLEGDRVRRAYGNGEDRQ